MRAASGESRAARIHRRRARKRLLTGGQDRPRLRELHRAHVATQRHPRIGLARAIAGWIVIALGLIGIVAPLVPAIVVIPAGVALVGRRQWLVRWCRTHMKLLLRRMETWPGFAGRLGLVARAAEKRLAKALRDRRIGKWTRPARR